MARFYLATNERAYRPCWNSLLLSDPTGLLEQQVLIMATNINPTVATDFFLLARFGVLHRAFKVNLGRMALLLSRLELLIAC